MNKILILYKSKYGSTKQYAERLKKALNCDLVEVSDLEKSDYLNYDVLIFAGSIRIGKINIIKNLQRQYLKIKDKQVIILCVGGAPHDEKNIATVKHLNLKNDLETLPFFYAQGIVNVDAMKFIDRTICKIGRKISGKQAPKNNALSNSRKHIDENNLHPLIKYIKALKQN